MSTTDTHQYRGIPVLTVSVVTPEGPPVITFPAPVPPLTIAEVATRCGVSRRTVERWIALEKIDYIRLGDVPKAPLRITEDALADFLARSTKRASANQRRGPGRPRQDEAEAS